MNEQSINDEKVLAQLLFIQSTLDVMPDKKGIASLVCDGLSHLPTVSSVLFVDQADLNDKTSLNISIGSRQRVHGYFIIESTNLGLLGKYKPYIQNVANSVALVLDNKKYIHELNQRKEELSNYAQQQTQELAESEQRFLDIMNASDEAIMLLNEDGVITQCNDAAALQLDFSSQQEIIGFTPEYISPFLQEDGTQSNIKLHTMIEQALERGFYRFEWDFKHQNNEVFTAEVTLSPIVHKGKSAVYCSWRDVSEQKKLQADRDTAEKKFLLYSRVFSDSHEGITIVDNKSNIVDVNPAFCEITGYSKEEVIGKNPRILSSGKQSPKFYQDMWQQINEQGYWQGEICNCNKQGEIYPELLTISTLKDEFGNIENYVAIFTDITRMKNQQEQLSLMAHYDVLTGLPNRALFTDRFAQAIAHSNRTKLQLAVCFLDLDNFKPINDNYGHEAGDLLLKEVAKRITANIREVDTVARQGGDEFTLLINDIKSFAECEQTLQRIHFALAEPYVINGNSHHITASSGVTLYPSDDGDIDTLLRHADQAMYKAKLAGKQSYRLFNPEHHQREIQKHAQLKHIKQALDNNELELYYQPKVNMVTGKVFGAEALMRWIHPEEGLIPPLDFLPALDGTQLEVEVGEWVINQAVSQLNKWCQQKIKLEVSINISSYHLRSKNFYNQLDTALSRYPAVEPQNLQLEILESSALGDLEHIRTIIEKCQSTLGVTVALDDFGTGYSSLTHLRSLSANTIKIDQSFVRDMIDDPDDYAIIDGIIGLASSFSQKVIAEGVESTAHGLELIMMGCEDAQGYSIAKPMPVVVFEQWLKDYTPNQAWLDIGISS